MHSMFLLPLLGLIVQGPPQDSLALVILRLEAQRRASHLSGDATQLATILADDFIDIGANGVPYEAAKRGGYAGPRHTVDDPRGQQGAGPGIRFDCSGRYGRAAGGWHLPW